MFHSIANHIVNTGLSTADDTIDTDLHIHSLYHKQFIDNPVNIGSYLFFRTDLKLG